MAATPSSLSSHADYFLHLADNALILGQRNAEWLGHGPVLEEDIAMANISLDLIGQARLLYQHIAPTLATACAALPPEGANFSRGGPSKNCLSSATEDTLAYFRDAPEFRNYTLLELPHGLAEGERDYAFTITRNFLYSALMVLLWEALQQSLDAQLAAIAARAVKEARYHLRHSRDWLVRLGDGTAESHQRTQAALNHLMPYTQAFWVPSDFESAATASGLAVDLAPLKTRWDMLVNDALAEATLQRPPASSSGTAAIPQGKNGLHSGYLGPLLADMQVLARQHPEATW